MPRLRHVLLLRTDQEITARIKARRPRYGSKYDGTARGQARGGVGSGAGRARERMVPGMAESARGGFFLNSITHQASVHDATYTIRACPLPTRGGGRVSSWPVAPELDASHGHAALPS
ncbi:hypothetical protein BRADI_1g13765v3 [Brachypodium distachyon]|uniref:Uncharacterized protein n=1 Tax=Brachypodium distachyon TaxID=15368 RepID=A0A2K2DJD4_BRADI|nr:hypothetical protein BRADI_1g13765v3 [Brachypodium distachyon]